jgi:hypothetical protein
VTIRTDRRIDILDANAEFAELDGRPAVHRALVQKARPAEQSAARHLPTEEQVGDRIERRRKRQVLIDGLDAELARSPGEDRAARRRRR